MRVDVQVESPVSDSARARQLEAMFDVPRAAKSHLEWHGDVDLGAQPWNVGLLVGPSGCGKSTLLAEMFDTPAALEWSGVSVVDDFAQGLSMDTIADACTAVGFNTIPAWLRPHDVLSTGEQFRVDLARRLAELPDPVVVDEFTSVVDRQVAQIGAYAVQKRVRRDDRRFVAATCHYDVIEWLQPDWILEPATMTLTWRSVQPRPRVDVTVSPVPYSAWRLFAPYHYLTADLNRTARCFCAFVDGRPVAFAGVLRRPHATAKNIMGVSRLVTLPDWQGLGLAFVLVDKVAELYKARGERLHTYPAHPALIRGFDRSPMWRMDKRPATFGPRLGKTSKIGGRKTGVSSPQLLERQTKAWHQGSRPCAVFEYVGPPAEQADADHVFAYWQRKDGNAMAMNATKRQRLGP